MSDIQTLKDHLGVFSHDVRCPLADWQLATIDHKPRETVTVAPRQSRKSTSLSVLALWWAYRKRNQNVLVVSASEDASRRLLSQIKDICVSSALLRSSAVDTETQKIALTNGSV